MCGRLNIVADPLMQWINDYFGMSFIAATNTDLRPTQQVATISRIDKSLAQLDLAWGIKPAWSKKLIINAQAETAASKKTFKNAFAMHRCLVPCTGWYEWKDEGGARKQQYSFTHAEGHPFLMAGIWFTSDDTSQLVTLTTQPNQKCLEIHKRMPVFILPSDANTWLSSSPESVQPLMTAIDSELIQIERC